MTQQESLWYSDLDFRIYVKYTQFRLSSDSGGRHSKVTLALIMSKTSNTFGKGTSHLVRLWETIACKVSHQALECGSALSRDHVLWKCQVSGIPGSQVVLAFHKYRPVFLSQTVTRRTCSNPSFNEMLETDNVVISWVPNNFGFGYTNLELHLRLLTL